MKNHPYFKFLCGTLIGLAGVLATTNTAQAVDIGAPVLEVWHTRTVTGQPQINTRTEAASSSLKDLGVAPRGSQGPIRTEDFSDRTTKVDSEMIRSDLLMQRYPVSNGVGIP